MLPLRQKIGLELTKPIIDRVIREHPLTTLFWECTLRCNLRCRHCGSDCKVTSELKDMPLEDFLPVLRSVARETDPHNVMINVTGGEPLVRQDLEKCGKAFWCAAVCGVLLAYRFGDGDPLVGLVQLLVCAGLAEDGVEVFRLKRLARCGMKERQRLVGHHGLAHGNI